MYQHTAIPFESLPFKDGFNIVKGDGKRKVAIFADPNCGYCKRLEADLKKVTNATITVFLYPVLGQDSVQKAKNIWCSNDKAATWDDWMLNGVVPPAAPSSCDTSAIDRLTAFGREKRITGTPTSYFVAGNRIPGAVPLQEFERLLDEKK